MDGGTLRQAVNCHIRSRGHVISATSSAHDPGLEVSAPFSRKGWEDRFALIRDRCVVFPSAWAQRGGGGKANDEKQVKEMLEDLVWITDSSAQGKYGGYPVEKFRSYSVESSPLDDALETKAPISS